MKRKLLLLLALCALAAGCESNTGGSATNTGGQTIDPTATRLAVQVDATQGATLSVLGHTLTIPAGALAQTALVQLGVVNQPVAQPPDADFRSVGPQLEVNLAGVSHADLTVALPALAASLSNARLQPVLVVNGVFVPLRMGTRPDGRVEARLDVDTGAVLAAGLSATNTFHVGFVERASRPPHVAWGTYNAYQFVNGSFRPFIQLGNVVEPVPNLGDRPLVIVHGLGDTIRDQEFVPLAQNLINRGIATGVVGFEYDTLDTITNNGQFLRQLYALLVQANPGRTFRHVAHSMGGLVSRAGIEAGPLTVPANGNRTAFVCSPHLGTQAAVILQSDLDLFQRVVAFVVMNDVMDFTNRDGQRCEPQLSDPGISDLRTDSPVLAALNANAAQNHPQWDYTTMAGDRRDLKYFLLDEMLGAHLSDGLVNVDSANAAVIGPVRTAVAPVDHSSAVTDPVRAFPVIEGLLTP